MIITSRIAAQLVPCAPYRAGDQVVLVLDEKQTCIVTKDQQGQHVRVHRFNQPVQEDLRVEDVKPISMRRIEA